MYTHIWEKLYPPPTKCSFWFLCLSVSFSKTLTGPTKPTNFDIKSTETLTRPTKPTKYRF